MGREVGGGFRIGNSRTPVADSCQCMAKPIQYYCKVKFKKIIKFFFKKAEILLCQQQKKKEKWLPRAGRRKMGE